MAANVPDRQFVTSLARGLAVLQCLSSAGRALGASEIAKAIKLPQPTAWRLCHTLLELGYLVRASNSDRFQLGIPVLGLGYSVLSTQTITELARAPMQEIAERSQGAVSLGAPSGLEIILLQRCRGRSIVLSELHAGSKLPIAYSASGWGYLAALSPARRGAVIEAIREMEGRRWNIVEPRFVEAMTEWRRTGFIKQKSVLHSTLNAVAVPICGGGDSEIFTLSGGGIASVFGDEVLTELGRALVDLAATLTNCLRAGGAHRASSHSKPTDA